MLLLAIAYLGGVLTILSPCILPVLPFVFARSDRPFLKSGLPLLAGMAFTFTLIASLAAVGGGWAVRANQFGRIAALLLSPEPPSAEPAPTPPSCSSSTPPAPPLPWPSPF